MPETEKEKVNVDTAIILIETAELMGWVDFKPLAKNLALTDLTKHVTGKKLRLPSNTIARAMIIYHHFKRCVGAVEYDDGLSAAAAIGLSAKVDEELLDCKSIVIMFWSILRKKTPLPSLSSHKFEQLEMNITKVQYFFCRMLKFTLKHELAHQYLAHFLRCLHKRKEFQEHWDLFVNVVWKIVSTAYLTKRCLDFDASDIAVACIHISCSFCRINVDSLQDWKQALSISFDERKLNHAIFDILAISSVSVLPEKNKD